jgi:hypothetical protein
MSGRIVVLIALLAFSTSAPGGIPGSSARKGLSKVAPRPAPAGHTIFSCRLPGGKVATVTGSGGGYLYGYGTARRRELTIIGTARSKTLFKRTEVHGGAWAIQLRFVRGEYSYVVHSFPRNEIVDNVPTSGLVVFRAGRRILDRNCSPWAEISFEDFEDLYALPDIPEGAPSVWGE